MQEHSQKANTENWKKNPKQIKNQATLRAFFVTGILWTLGCSAISLRASLISSLGICSSCHPSLD